MKRAVLYLRVSTTEQTTDDQERELREVAFHIGVEITNVYRDHGISGSKGREKRPAFDALCRDATRRKFDLIMAWSVDRLGRSLRDLVGFLSAIHAAGVDLFQHQQGPDTRTPSGRAMCGMMSVFAEGDRQRRHCDLPRACAGTMVQIGHACRVSETVPSAVGRARSRARGRPPAATRRTRQHSGACLLRTCGRYRRRAVLVSPASGRAGWSASSASKCRRSAGRSWIGSASD
jgi:hypothetical protein